MLHNENERRSLILNDSEQQLKKKNAVRKSNSVVKKLLDNERFNENESKLPLMLMPKGVLHDRLLRRGDLKWRRPNKRKLHLLQFDPSLV